MHAFIFIYVCYVFFGNFPDVIIRIVNEGEPSNLLWKDFMPKEDVPK